MNVSNDVWGGCPDADIRALGDKVVEISVQGVVLGL
jgi:hypothetical protein